MEAKDIVLRSEEVNEIFSKMPSHIVRWGNTWILIVILSLLTLAYFVKYPDIITGNATLTSSAAPVTLVAQTHGKIKLIKENYTSVNIGDRIAYSIEDGQISHIDSLYSILKAKDIDSIRGSSFPNWTLGKLQTNWSRFLVELQAYEVYRKANPEQIGIASSGQQIAKNSQSVTNLKEQIQLRESQLDFFKNKLDKDKTLVDKGMIPEREYQNSYSQWIEMQNQVKGLKSQLISIDKNNTDYQKQIADYQITKTQQESQKTTSLKQMRITLLEELELWYKTNTLTSPVSGTLQYNAPLIDNQFVQQGMELFTINPLDKREIECNLYVPMAGMGKVAIGQKVILRMQHYPEEEFGILNGNVTHISPSPIVIKGNEKQEKVYLLKVKLSKGLTTSYNKEITYQPNMEGTADIVTKDRSFLERIFEQLIKLVKR